MQHVLFCCQAYRGHQFDTEVACKLAVKATHLVLVMATILILGTATHFVLGVATHLVLGMATY